MKEVSISQIKIDELRQEQVVYLKETKGKRVLPVAIGLPEVNAIKIKLSGFEMPRPLTHDLILKITEALDAKVNHVCVDRLHDHTFFAKIVLQKNSPKAEQVFVDARPSDSIAIALRANVPIFVEDSVLDAAGVIPNS